MKEITKERKVKYTVYQAVDGTEFTDSNECLSYEQSALGVIRAKLSKLIVYDTRRPLDKGTSHQDAWTLFGGCEDHDVVAVRMNRKSGSDYDTVLHWLLLECPYYNNDANKELRNSIFDIIEEACINGDVLIFGINCDGEYYFINSRQNIINNLNAMLGKEADNAE